MIKPEKYLEMEINKLYDNEQPYIDEGVYDGNINPIFKAIKQAQLDAIDETIKKCGNEVVKIQKPDLRKYISKKALLDVGIKLKKELE